MITCSKVKQSTSSHKVADVLLDLQVTILVKVFKEAKRLIQEADLLYNIWNNLW